MSASSSGGTWGGAVGEQGVSDGVRPWEGREAGAGECAAGNAAEGDAVSDETVGSGFFDSLRSLRMTIPPARPLSQLR